MEKIEECKVAKYCIYGSALGNSSSYMCDYIGDTKHSRVKNNPKGEIVNGKCGYFEVKDERKSNRAKDRWCREVKGWPLSKMDESWVYRSSGPHSDFTRKQNHVCGSQKTWPERRQDEKTD